MEKDWKADLLLVQKLMGSQIIGKKEQKTWQKSRPIRLTSLRKSKHKIKKRERTPQNKKKKQSGWNIVLCRKQEGCYLSQ